MRLRWLNVVFVVLTLFLSALPVQAAIITIRPSQTPKIIPSQADFDKITRLQGITNISALTPVSPDDQSMLIAYKAPGASTQFEFMNIQDSSTQPVSRDILQLTPLTNLVWLDSHTVGYFSLTFNPANENGPVVRAIEVLVQIDRATGKVTKQPLKLPGVPASLSPDGTRALLVNSNLNDLLLDSNGTLEYQSPFNQLLRRGFGKTDATEQDAEPQELKDWLKYINQAERRKMGSFAIQDDLDLLLSSITVSLTAIDLKSGKTLSLGDLAPGSNLASIAWSADSSRLAISHVTLSDEGRGGLLLSDVAVQDALGNLSTAKNPFLQGNSVDAVDFNGGQVTKELLKGTNGNGDLFTGLAWNTGGTVLGVHMERPGHLAGRANPTYLYTERSYIRFYTPQGELLSTLDKPDIEDPIYSTPQFVGPDELLINAIRGMSDRIFYYNLTTGEFRQLPIADGLASLVRPTHHSRQIVFGYSSYSQAPELMRINMDGQALYRLTFYNEALSQYGRVRADQVSFTLANGQVRTGYLLQDPGATFPPNPQRMVVWQEGGPTEPMLNQWGTIVERPFNLLPHFGMSVLIVPLPGRLGFGSAFLNGLADNANFGQIDIDEQAEIVRQSISRGYTKAGSVGITGCSYGGYFTSQSIVRYPDLYSAANSQCTLLDLFNEWQLGYTSLMSYLEGRAPTVDPAEYLKDSPFYHASVVKTPLLLFDGLHDFLPVEASGNFHDQVQANGAAVNLLVFSAAGHGLSSVHDEIIAAQAQIAWFQQFLPDPGSRAAPTSLQSDLWEKFAKGLKQ